MPSSGTRRLIGGVIGLVSSVVLVMAMLMSPSSRGLGTHQQLNLPPCGWIAVADVPCLTCGMTTSFSHAVRGELLQSLLAQPMGFLLAVGTAMAVLVGFYVLVTGSHLGMLLGRLFNGRTLWMLAAFGLLAWIYKILAYKEIL